MTDEAEAPASAEATPAAAPEPTEAEVKARELGWTPKAEFKGNPENWTDAEEYIKRGDPRYLRERLGQTEKTVRALEEKLKRETAEQQEAFKARLEQMDRVNQKLLKSQRQAIYDEIEARKLQAVEDGDTEAYRKLQKAEIAQREQHTKEDEELTLAAPTKPGKAGDKVDGHDDEIAAWWADHPDVWMDEKKASYVGLLYGRAEKNPELDTTAKRLRFVEDGLKRINGGRATTETEEAAPEAGMPRVEGGARMAGPRAKGWNDIPGEERAIYDRHIKEKLYKDRAEAAAAHWSN